MNRTEAKKIALTITPDDMREMFLNAQIRIDDWTQAAIVNKGLSKGTVFNIFTRDIDNCAKWIYIAKCNAIREFGQYIPGYEKPIKEKKKLHVPAHQDPVFLKA